MERNNTSTPSFSICKKIRQLLATNPAFRAIHRMKQHQQEPRPIVITQHHHPQNIKVNTEGEGAIPIVFDYYSNGTNNGNSSALSNGKAPKALVPSHVGISERTGKVGSATTKVEQPQHQKQGKQSFSTNEGKTKEETKGPLKEQHHGIGTKNLEQQGEKPLDLNDTFAEYIQRVKGRIRTVSNVGRGQNNSAPDEANGYGGGGGGIIDQKDHFSEFIQHAKKKIRTTSNVGRTSSLKRA